VSIVNSSTSIVFIASLIIINAVPIVYTINSVVAGIYALRGYRFKNRLIHSFIQD
jgi:hypothetical protein